MEWAAEPMPAGTGFAVAVQVLAAELTPWLRDSRSPGRTAD